MYTYEFICLFCYQENQTLPDRIFVFRDGVGDGQMATVADYEVPQISSCFSMFGECEGGVGEGVCGRVCVGSVGKGLYVLWCLLSVEERRTCM